MARFLIRGIVIVILVYAAFIIGVMYYIPQTVDLNSDSKRRDEVREIYNKLITVSGLATVRPKLVFGYTGNDGTNGEMILIDIGLITRHSDDEIAFILGHELAHVHLGHTQGPQPDDLVLSQFDEAMADKLGAFYMMRAGYNICIGREFWKKQLDKTGNMLFTTHPNHSYRYELINIGCK